MYVCRKEINDLGDHFFCRCTLPTLIPAASTVVCDRRRMDAVGPVRFLKLLTQARIQRGLYDPDPPSPKICTIVYIFHSH